MVRGRSIAATSEFGALAVGSDNFRIVQAHRIAKRSHFRRQLVLHDGILTRMLSTSLDLMSSTSGRMIRKKPPIGISFRIQPVTRLA